MSQIQIRLRFQLEWLLLLRNAMLCGMCAFACVAILAAGCLASDEDIVRAATESAGLNDVAVLSENVLVSIGDRGLILQSEDGGHRWQSRYSPSHLTLHAVASEPGCLLAVGGEIGPYTKKSSGVVLRSVDRGRTWQIATQDNLPRLIGVAVQSGRWLAWGDFSPAHRSVCFESNDQGRTWQPLPAKLSHVAAGNASIDGVCLVDLLGRTELGGNTQAEHSHVGSGGVINTVVPIKDFWLAAGQRGKLLLGGAELDGWASVGLPISDSARELISFKALATSGPNVWLAGNPGTILFHSDDGGLSWSKSNTGIPTPVSSLEFFDAARGWAVTKLGGIWATRDGGRSWYSQRHAPTRLSVLSISQTDSSAAWIPLATAAWDHQVTAGSIDLRENDAVLEADHVPSHGRTIEAIASQIGLSFHEHRPSPGGSIAKSIAFYLASWRPDVLLQQNPVTDGAASQNSGHWQDALAMQNDASTQQALAELGLQYWRPIKIVQVCEPRPNVYSESSSKILSQVGLTVEDLLGMLPVEERVDTTTMQTVWTASNSPEVHERLMGGIAPTEATRLNTGTRRSVGSYQVVVGRMARQQAIQRMIAQASELPFEAWQEQLQLAFRVLPTREVGPMLVEAAGKLRHPTTWRHYEYLLENLTAQGSSRDAAIWAASQLVTSGTSDELLAWNRMFEAQTDNGGVSLASAQSTPNQVSTADPAAVSSDASSADDRAKVWSGSPFGDLPGGTPADVLPGGAVVSAAAHTAIRSAEKLTSENPMPPAIPSKLTPPLVADESWLPPHQRFSQAVLSRNHGLLNGTDLQFTTRYKLLSASVQRRASGTASDLAAIDTTHRESPLLGWPQMLSQEQSVARGTALNQKWSCSATGTVERPKLDGVLDEACWLNNTKHMQLSAPFGTPKSKHPTTVRFAFDSEYLYVAIEAPIVFGTQIPTTSNKRGYDANLNGVDHVELLLDTDRDYNTAVHLGIASDGRTFDRCGGMEAYNPRWFVAHTANEQRWTAELAIQLENLTLMPPAPGDVWAVTARRTGPEVESQSWSRLRTTALLPHSAGVLVFESAQ
ncbi:MAG TPA: hypothetical protein DDW52_18640 [Planctomycetaceae bacterium]|nr:hypothetical protein [Planctomycetaceae bacterium]